MNFVSRLSFKLRNGATSKKRTCAEDDAFSGDPMLAKQIGYREKRADRCSFSKTGNSKLNLPVLNLLSDSLRYGVPERAPKIGFSQFPVLESALV